MALFNKSSGNTIAEILWSDTHIGERCSLMYPDKAIDWRLNMRQRWLYDTWANHFIPDIERVLGRWKADYVHATALGDMGSLKYKYGHPDDFWATNETQVTINAGQLFDPIAKLADDIHFVYGNDAHIGPQGKLDHEIAADFDNTVPLDADNGLFAHPSIDLEFQGLLFNYTHKGANRTKWTTANGLNSMKAEITLNRAENGERIPDVVGRGHFHWSGHTPLDMKPYVVSVPSWELPSDFIRYIDHLDKTPYVGGHVIIVRDGQIVDASRLVYTMERNQPWQPK